MSINIVRSLPEVEWRRFVEEDSAKNFVEDYAKYL